MGSSASAAHSSGFWALDVAMATEGRGFCMPAGFHPEPSPETSSPWGVHAVAFTDQTILLRKLGGRGRQGEGPRIWGLGKRAPMGKNLWPPFPGKVPSPSPVLQLGRRRAIPLRTAT